VNKLRQAWAEDRPAFGGWCLIPAAFGAEVLAAAGFDYVCVDCQHGLIGYDAMAPMLSAIGRSGAAAIVRVPSLDSAWIGKALDAGADGVIVPLVNSAEDAAAAGAACRYPPLGARSFGPVRAGVYGGGSPEDANRDVVCMVMIETAAGLAEAEGICSSAGIDGVYIGPSDLALSLGVTPTLRPTDPKHVDAIARVLASCRKAGIVGGIHTASGAQSAVHAEAGFRMITVTTDLGLITAGAARELATARGN
jgi:4-hydroxy-2-oxoheptanedioate aldolase